MYRLCSYQYSTAKTLQVRARITSRNSRAKKSMMYRRCVSQLEEYDTYGRVRYPPYDRSIDRFQARKAVKAESSDGEWEERVDRQPRPLSAVPPTDCEKQDAVGRLSDADYHI